ncbi:hypothetical protein KBB05_00855 [Patescibacteria group bacterium]|nr:hypothetical protein [Patescibacteria group bacterium]
MVSGKKSTINMIEMDGAEISEESMQQAFTLGQTIIDELCAMQEDFLMKIGG